MPERGVHATLVRVHGRGVLIQGPAGSGKSTLALQLVRAGHALVADDLVLLQQQQGQLFGSAADSAEGRLAIRGAGILPIFQLFGPQSVHGRPQSIDWRVELDAQAQATLPSHVHSELDGVSLPTLQLRAGVDHGALIEACCRAGSPALLCWAH